MLLLGFLRSAAPFLAKGPIPVIAKKKKPKDDDEEEDDKEGSEVEDEAGSAQTIASRGSILVTLRNVEPYTSW